MQYALMLNDFLFHAIMSASKSMQRQNGQTEAKKVGKSAAPAWPDQAFCAAFADVAACVQVACAVTVIWKDADPHRWAQWPAHLSQHRQAYCRAIKAKPEQMSRCISADTAPPATEEAVPRQCPFGVREMTVSFSRQQELCGWCFIGAWRDKTPRGIAHEHQSRWRELPIWQPQQAQATAELVRRLVQGILHLRAGTIATSDQRLQHCYELVDQHLDATLRAHHLADWLGLSPSRFVHWFKEISGEPISSYLQRRLMERAAQHLLRDEQSITALAYDLGFRSSSAFSTSFKAYHGSSPSQWRQTTRRAAE